MSTPEDIGKKIKQARLNQNLTQQELGSKLGMNKSTIQRYETGKIDKIKLPILESIAEFLNVSPEWLIGKELIATPMGITTDNITDNEKTILELFSSLTETQQGELIGRAKMMIEQNQAEYRQEDAG